MRIVLTVLATSFQLVCSSSILIDWSATTVPESIAYVLDYAPAVGNPPAGTSLGRRSIKIPPNNLIDIAEKMVININAEVLRRKNSARRALISDTIPACEYTVYLSAIMPDGKRKHVIKETIYSSPLPPILDTIETSEHEATVSYFPPKEANISFHIEYYPEDHPDYANVIETKASLVRLRGLDSGTPFRIKINSLYNGVPSTKAIESIFRTTGTPEYDYDNSAETFSIRTLPPGFDLATTTMVPSGSDYMYSTEDLDESSKSSVAIPISAAIPSISTAITTAPQTKQMVMFSKSGSASNPSQPSIATSISSTNATSAAETSASSSATVPTLTTDVTTYQSTIAAITTPTESAVRVMSKQPPQITTRRPVAEEIETYDDQSENQELLSAQQMASDFGEPSWISMSDEENMIRLNWTVPDGSLCDAFLVNYTVITLTRPKSFSVATTDDFLLIKFFTNHTLDVRVFCMLAGSVSKTWWAHRIIQMTNPQQVQGFRIVSYETDEFYVSRISVDWDWPPYNNFDLYQIVVSYGINDGAMTEVEVTEAAQKPLVLDKLEPTQRYLISVRNESLELGLSSNIVQLEQMTPPLISSMISPGKISSTSININFGDSDIEQGRFDYYELVFTGNNKNITKKIEINQETVAELAGAVQTTIYNKTQVTRTCVYTVICDDARKKSLTFTKLIPGKTYLFTLYTVYKGVRSRPVTEAITTYPLKVNALYPVVGREYVVLYWDIENFADSDCRFRLSYNADRVATVSVELKGASRHRFNALMPDVYYTFTITVIMGTGKAAAESESEMITVYVPREGRFSPTLQRQGSRELTVKFGNDHQVFSPLNGAIENVAVIVSDAIDMNDDDYELKSWFEVKDEDTWGSYRASPSVWNPFKKSSNEVTFTIGSDDCIRRSLDEPYCNGILRANVNYKVKLRAYMDTKVAMESDWISIDGQASDEEEDKSERRLPCHMYLNGCPRKSGTVRDFSTASVVLLLLWLL